MSENLGLQIVKAIEAGADKQLSRSIKYSPFRLFYKLFKRSNAKLMDQIRNQVRYDIEDSLRKVEDYNSEIFMLGTELTDSGQEFLRLCYNLGIHLVKRKLTVKMAFKVVTNHDIRMEVYNYVLKTTARIASRIIHH